MSETKTKAPAKRLRAIPVVAELWEYEREDGSRTWIAVYKAEVDGREIALSIANEAYGAPDPEAALRQARPSIFGL